MNIHGRFKQEYDKLAPGVFTLILLWTLNAIAVAALIYS